MTPARRWIVLLAASAATFAGTTIYLWRELAEERAQPPVVNLAVPQPTLIEVSRPANGFSASGPAMQARKPVSAPRDLDPNVEPDEFQRQQSRQLLEQLANPATRARLLEESKANARSAYPWVTERLKLSPEEYERLIEGLARMSLESREDYARCTVASDCNLSDFGQRNSDRQTQVLTELLGPERLKIFETYQQTMTERETVVNLRGRLPDQAYLSTGDAETLVDALADESWQARRDAQLAGQGLTGFGMSGGWIYYVDQGSTQQRVQSAEAYVNRMIARAAQVLTSDQLRYFTQMQQDLLANLRGQLEKIDSEKQ